MKKHAKELQFINRIKGDGSGVIEVDNQTIAFYERIDAVFELKPLSLTKGTFIAYHTFTYVVKLK